MSRLQEAARAVDALAAFDSDEGTVLTNEAAVDRYLALAIPGVDASELWSTADGVVEASLLGLAKGQCPNLTEALRGVWLNGVAMGMRLADLTDDEREALRDALDEAVRPGNKVALDSVAQKLGL